MSNVTISPNLKKESVLIDSNGRTLKRSFSKQQSGDEKDKKIAELEAKLKTLQNK